PPVQKGDEGVVYLGLVLVVLEVVAVDAGDHGDLRVGLEKRAEGLVGLGDQDVARAEAGARTDVVQVAADDEGRLEAGAVQDTGDHRRRRGLAVRAGDRYTPARIHETA